METQIAAQDLVYDDGEMAIALVQRPSDSSGPHLALRWLAPQPCVDRDGKEVCTTNLMGGETDWFIVPFSLAVGIARTLIEQKAAGLGNFNNDGFAKMVSWLVGLDQLQDAMCY
ncbi:MAG TPA: hypothetical protein PLP01_14740 [Phycisphaerae bacterium]|nr:hypothetical protein [Phycisphaerae bacterium]HOI56503.1 hypothetical protein [Phycisphaerae bacterium]